MAADEDDVGLRMISWAKLAMSIDDAFLTCPPRMFPVLELGYGYSERGHHGKKALYS